MMIIDDKKELRQHLDFNKKVGFIDIGGYFHEGHAFIIHQLRKIVDTLIVVYVEWNRHAEFFLHEKGILPYQSQLCSLVKKSMEKFPSMISDIDFFVYSPITPFIQNQVENLIHVKETCKEFCEELGVGLLHTSVLMSVIYDDDLKFLYKDHSYTGPKNILVDMIARKLLNSQEIYAPKYLWETLRDPVTFCAQSRTSVSPLLGEAVSRIHHEILTTGQITSERSICASDGSKIEVSIVDIDTIKSVEQPTKNCVPVVSYYKDKGNYCDFLFIENGMAIA